jgi:hypothetical protein
VVAPEALEVIPTAAPRAIVPQISRKRRQTEDPFQCFEIERRGKLTLKP